MKIEVCYDRIPFTDSYQYYLNVNDCKILLDTFNQTMYGGFYTNKTDRVFVLLNNYAYLVDIKLCKVIGRIIIPRNLYNNIKVIEHIKILSNAVEMSCECKHKVIETCYPYITLSFQSGNIYVGELGLCLLYTETASKFIKYVPCSLKEVITDTKYSYELFINRRDDIYIVDYKNFRVKRIPVGKPIKRIEIVNPLCIEIETESGLKAQFPLDNWVKYSYLDLVCERFKWLAKSLYPENESDRFRLLLLGFLIAALCMICFMITHSLHTHATLT